ncbi:21055_t:CDS:2 [Entrophospora sp. SA101]|nr:21055_t:CDS:2 [Entrophospora sp. SA101]
MITTKKLELELLTMNVRLNVKPVRKLNLLKKCQLEFYLVLVKEDEKQTYEAYANPHVAEEKRIYQRYLKLKNKFSDGKQKLREKKQRLAELEGDKQQEKDTKKPTN